LKKILSFFILLWFKNFPYFELSRVWYLKIELKGNGGRIIKAGANCGHFFTKLSFLDKYFLLQLFMPVI